MKTVSPSKHPARAAATAEQKVLVAFKTLPSIRDRAANIAAASGISLTDVLNMSLRQYITKQSIEALPVYQMSAELEADLAKIEDDIKHGRNPIVATASTPEEIDALFDDIRAGKYDD